MFRSSMARWLFGMMLFLAVVTLLRFKPWQRKDAQQAAVSSAEPRQS